MNINVPQSYPENFRKLQKPNMSLDTWNSGTSYELTIYKIIMWPLGIWPLNRGELFSDIRLFLAAITQVSGY